MGAWGGGGFTHPPLKAPTGFRTGRAVAVASCRRAEDRNGREGRRGGRGEVWRKARREGARSLEAMVEGWSLVGFVACSVVYRDGLGMQKEGGFGWYELLSVCDQWGKTLGMGK